ncbi:MAG TPA: serine/threonine-protein kinase [Labilithrix sp.]|nr:serine/threonine-protein kinase [Labilithrix sp.]
MSLSPGTLVGEKYELQQLLGKGGMGAVYAARHLALDGLFAIKFLSPGALDRDEAHARFYGEAKAAALLTNEHVAHVCDVGIHDGDELYIVMEHLEGKDLGVLAAERGAFPAFEAAGYGIQVCEALAEAHANRIIHRDIKLANLFVTHRYGQPFIKVLDFGISKVLGVGDVTRTAAMLGSPKYMSPEQMNDPRTVDGRSDIWSLGVVLYRLVSGVMPFDGETLGRVCMLILNEQPAPLRAIRPDLAAGFEHVVHRCLEKDPARRFQTVADLAAALAPFAAASSPSSGATALLGSNGPRVIVPSVSRMDGSNATWSSTDASNATQMSEGVAAPAARSRSVVVGLVAAAVGLAAVLGFVGVTTFARPRETPPASSGGQSAAAALEPSAPAAIAPGTGNPLLEAHPAGLEGESRPPAASAPSAASSPVAPLSGAPVRPATKHGPPGRPPVRLPEDRR